MSLAELQVPAIAVQRENHAREVDGVSQPCFPGNAETDDVLSGEVVAATACTQDYDAVDHTSKIEDAEARFYCREIQRKQAGVTRFRRGSRIERSVNAA